MKRKRDKEVAMREQHRRTATRTSMGCYTTPVASKGTKLARLAVGEKVSGRGQFELEENVRVEGEAVVSQSTICR